MAKCQWFLFSSPSYLTFALACRAFLLLPRGVVSSGPTFRIPITPRGWLEISLAANRGHLIGRHESRPSGCGCLMTPTIDNDSPETQNTLPFSSCSSSSSPSPVSIVIRQPGNEHLPASANDVGQRGLTPNKDQGRLSRCHRTGKPFEAVSHPDSSTPPDAPTRRHTTFAGRPTQCALASACQCRPPASGLATLLVGAGGRPSNRPA